MNFYIVRRNIMIAPQSISERLMYLTVRLVSGPHTATGFIYKTPNHTHVIIANRHFAEKTDKLDYSKTTLTDTLSIKLHLINGANAVITDSVNWHLHPTCDLAFFNLDELIKKHPKNYFFLSLTSQDIPTQSELNDLGALEDVVMVGYPDGRYDALNNYPIFRYGKTATHPAVDYNGQKIGMIDVPCLPGSSGSPVAIINEGFYYNKTGVTQVGNRFIFLGIEVSMPCTLQDVYEKDINGDLKATKKYYYYHDLSLGNYIKSEEFNKFNSIFASLSI